MKKVDAVIKSVLERIKPSEDEIREVNELVKLLENAGNKVVMEAGGMAKVQGSIAHGTWIAGEKDVDLFLIFPSTVDRESLLDYCYKVAEEINASEVVEAYAEHPYVRAKLGDYTIDIVPCYKIADAKFKITSADRTPLHTEYVLKHIDDRLRDEIRLLKQFMKGIGVYGAEIKVRGFSGYLCELLIIHYGSFIDCIKDASNWRHKKIIDIEGYYKDFPEKLNVIFNEPLVVVDPVDSSRNVAASVSLENFYRFREASRAFLTDPSEKFFFPSEVTPLSPEDCLNKMSSRGTDFIVITCRRPNVVDDILWGQINKSVRALRNLLKTWKFNVVRIEADASDEKLYFIIELEHIRMPKIEIHKGPLVTIRIHSANFVRKYTTTAKDDVFSGPYIRGGRWYVERKRKYSDARVLLLDYLLNKLDSSGIASRIRRSIKKEFDMFVNEEIMSLYKNDSFFAKFFTHFLEKIEPWLR